MRCLVAISHAEAALTKMSFVGSAIARRAAGDRVSSPASHQSRACVSSSSRNATDPAVPRCRVLRGATVQRNSGPTVNWPFSAPKTRCGCGFGDSMGTSLTTGFRPRAMMISSRPRRVRLRLAQPDPSRAEQARLLALAYRRRAIAGLALREQQRRPVGLGRSDRETAIGQCHVRDASTFQIGLACRAAFDPEFERGDTWRRKVGAG